MGPALFKGGEGGGDSRSGGRGRGLSDVRRRSGSIVALSSLQEG